VSDRLFVEKELRAMGAEVERVEDALDMAHDRHAGHDREEAHADRRNN